ncbi:phosphatase domain-containing putative toxin [Pseudooceanicola spongiae]|jgi:protein tyrosine/serine phosphatase|uniref:Protein tyrosine phosphatase n=1 Tax=Pseudooceanicola spongiae TaxID=2613965 RepID=A0A7L9WPU1_9RHOB|nr:tyrosine-protein phosphatase [Pseudooceanicola spongiae]QOL81080.1 protein tyrosine phosphatase [Pseudooceanicola spongiae]
MKLVDRIKTWERNLRASYNTDLSTPENRRRAAIYNRWFDHAVLRGVWTNFFEIAPGVFRSNHPTHDRFAAMKAQGIRSVLNLRGAAGAAHYLTEQESCRALGLTLIDRNLYARQAASAEEILSVIEAFRQIEKPFVMHCKSGADRAGFASAIYLMVIEGRPVAEARKMLSPKYVHFKFTKTGILDHILDAYAKRQSLTGIGFEDWVRTEYDPKTLQAEFNARNRWAL